MDNDPQNRLASVSNTEAAKLYGNRLTHINIYDIHPAFKTKANLDFSFRLSPSRGIDTV